MPFYVCNQRLQCSMANHCPEAAPHSHNRATCKCMFSRDAVCVPIVEFENPDEVICPECGCVIDLD